jgi:hypothetical protein
MSAVQTAPVIPPADARRGSLLAGATALAFAAEAVVAAVWPTDLSDHATGAGRVSEALAGLGFLLAAGALGTLGTGRLRAWFALGLLGCAAVGVAQVDIAARGQEWSESVTTVIVLAAWAGLVLAGVVGTRAGAWSWPIGAALAVVVPALFFVPSPFNSVVICLLWLAVAAVTRRGARVG